MFRERSLALVCFLIAASPLAASATPFSDVPARSFAFSALQTLAADGLIEGYADGTLKGDRPLTRYEAAVLVARVVAKIAADDGTQRASDAVVWKRDVELVKKLEDQFRDELDALGVRVTGLENALDTLDKRTQLAQRLEFHGTMLPNGSFRQRTTLSRTIVNTTAVAQPLYYGGSVAPGRSAIADPFVTAFLPTNETNDPLTADGSGLRIRYDDKFSLLYNVNDNLTISIPFHLLNFQYGGEFTQQSSFGISPGVDIHVAKSGLFSNLLFRYGTLDDMKPSRLGLAFRPPDGGGGSGSYIPYENPLQPFQKGISVAGTFSGLTDFQLSFSRVDQTLYDTLPALNDPASTFGTGGYLLPVVPPQSGYTQNAPAGALTSATFSAGANPLTQVFLTRKATLGSVFISQYNGTLYNSTGQIIGGGSTPAPAFTYNDALNNVVFGSPLPPGSNITISFTGLNATGNTIAQRYMIHGRLNQRFNGKPGAEIGLTFNRVFDFDDPQTTADVSALQSGAVQGFGLVSDTVFGIDFQWPVSTNVILFGEGANSKFTADVRNVAAISDNAGVLGIRLTSGSLKGSLQYQNVGPNYLDGAPFRYFGNAPALFAAYKLPYFPGFFGFSNTFGINQQFDTQFAGTSTKSNSLSNPNLTYAAPVFNPFQANGPFYFQAFAPNSAGFSASISAPIKFGGYTIEGRLNASHLTQVQANSAATSTYALAPPTSVRAAFDHFEGNAAFAVPAFGRRVAVTLSGAYELLSRGDRTPVQYYPFNPASGASDAAAVAAAAAAFGSAGSLVSYYPNYINERHITVAAAGSVPISRDVTLAGFFNSQRFGGSNGTTVAQNISQRKDTILANLLYAIPNTSSTIALVARTYKYTDAVVPTFNLTQNRQDITFTVRF